MNINGNELFVETYGNPKDEVIVFLNGVMASTNSWGYYVKAFMNSHYIILHDFKGQLKSDKPKGPYTFMEHAEETIMILRELGIKKAHFIGTSYGGEVGMKIAAFYPEFVISLSVISSVSELEEPLKKEIKHWIELCKKQDGYAFFWGMAHKIYGKIFMEKNKRFLEERAQATKHVDPSYFEGQIILYETFLTDVSMTKELHRITVPTLIMCGTEDELKPPRYSDIIHKNIKGSEYILIPDSGHVAIFEQPEFVINALERFINKQKTS